MENNWIYQEKQQSLIFAFCVVIFSMSHHQHSKKQIRITDRNLLSELQFKSPTTCFQADYLELPYE